MSDKTRTAIEDAIRAHIADEEPGQILTGYVAFAAAYSPEDDDDGSGATAYWRLIPGGQPVHITLGLVEQYRSSFYAAANAEED